MHMTVSSQLRIDDPTPELLAWCKKNLVLANPDYAKKARMNFYLGNTPQKLYLMQWDGDTLVLPYGCFNDVLRLAPFTDVSMAFAPQPRVDYRCNIPLYDYQEAAKAALAENGRGILQSPAGSGKTQIGIALACEIGQKTLWLTHTRDLLLQSKNRAEQYMSPALTGTITEGKVQIGKAITFATVQTMCNIDLDRYRDTWGCIIVDECHRVAGTPTAVTQFSKVLSSLAAKHKYGLSATVHRADGMIAATYALLGKIAYQVPEEAVADKIMTVSVLPRPTRVGLSKDFLDTDGTIMANWTRKRSSSSPEAKRSRPGTFTKPPRLSCLNLPSGCPAMTFLPSMIRASSPPTVCEWWSSTGISPRTSRTRTSKMSSRPRRPCVASSPGSWRATSSTSGSA